MSVERQKKSGDGAEQKTNFRMSHGRGCTVIDLVLRRFLIDIKWPRASSYVLKTAIFLPDPLASAQPTPQRTSHIRHEHHEFRRYGEVVRFARERVYRVVTVSYNTCTVPSYGRLRQTHSRLPPFTIARRLMYDHVSRSRPLPYFRTLLTKRDSGTMAYWGVSCMSPNVRPGLVRTAGRSKRVHGWHHHRHIASIATT